MRPWMLNGTSLVSARTKTVPSSPSGVTALAITRSKSASWPLTPMKSTHAIQRFPLLIELKVRLVLRAHARRIDQERRTDGALGLQRGGE